MGLWKSLDSLQEKMNKLFNGLDYVRTYIDNLLIISHKFLDGHMKKMDKAQNKLKSSDEL